MEEDDITCITTSKNVSRAVYPIVKHSWENGDSYEGMVRNGKRHGHGVYKYADGTEYKGEWRENKKQGQGQYIWNNGDKYTGRFCFDLPSVFLSLRLLEHGDGKRRIPVPSADWCENIKYKIEQNQNCLFIFPTTHYLPPAANKIQFNYFGLFKITTPTLELLEYNCFDSDGNIDTEKRDKYNLLLEKKRLLMVFDCLGKKGVLPLGDKKDISAMLESIGYCL